MSLYELKFPFPVERVRQAAEAKKSHHQERLDFWKEQHARTIKVTEEFSEFSEVTGGSSSLVSMEKHRAESKVSTYQNLLRQMTHLLAGLAMLPREFMVELDINDIEELGLSGDAPRE